MGHGPMGPRAHGTKGPRDHGLIGSWARGQGRAVCFAARIQSSDFPLPPKPAGALAFHYPRSEGFVYEARAVHAALRAGKTALDEWTHAESLTTQAIVDAMRAAVVSA